MKCSGRAVRVGPPSPGTTPTRHSHCSITLNFASGTKWPGFIPASTPRFQISHIMRFGSAIRRVALAREKGPSCQLDRIQRVILTDLFVGQSSREKMDYQTSPTIAKAARTSNSALARAMNSFDLTERLTKLSLNRMRSELELRAKLYCAEIAAARQAA